MKPLLPERTARGPLACWLLRSGGYQAWVAEQGAQVLEYGRAGGPPVLWLSPQAQYLPGVSVRGGVPVCWPWFNDLARTNPEAVRQSWPRQAGEGAAPAHGFARGLPWHVLGSGADPQACWLHLRLPRTQGPDWPQAVEPEVRIRLSADGRLRIALRNHNAGAHSVTIGQALHTYFAVGDVRRASVSGLDGKTYLDTVGAWQQRVQHGPVRFEGEVDRIYQDVPAELAIDDPVLGRRVHLRAEGSRSAIVWNPHVEKARRLSQFPDEAWTGMLCVETANVMQDALALAPGQAHELAVSLWETPAGHLRD
ncbi:D-hexose-6-phosphate mutarotase [Orrella sp. JC864]|uniref:D-hexose-6-phosphate mutarotase n=1 Tax=Orrella sp. JC864 TaxID=3120298 RepID=UPI0012BD778E